MPDPAVANDQATGPDGAGQLIIALYSLLALAAGGRAAVQLATRPDDAPVAYGLSAAASLIYLTGAVLIRRTDPCARQAARVCCAIELAGVLAVGTASVTTPEAFPDASVWSSYGEGYGFLPVVLPVAALAWLWRHQRLRSSSR
jgi:hypothetical protein